MGLSETTDERRACLYFSSLAMRFSIFSEPTMKYMCCHELALLRLASEVSCPFAGITTGKCHFRAVAMANEGQIENVD